jgi:predicted enzyme related to lactoylglutathione lyase
MKSGNNETFGWDRRSHHSSERVVIMAKMGQFPMTAVLRAEDLGRARRFYSEVLGLQEEEGMDSASEAAFKGGDGTRVLLYERPGMPAPQNTTLGFAVPKDMFDEAVKDLRDEGVRFEGYDLPEIGLKTVDGVAEYDGMKVAFFKDTEGNIVSVGSF